MVLVAALGCGPDDAGLTMTAGESTTAVDTPPRLEPTTEATTMVDEGPLPPSIGCECARPQEELFESYDVAACGWGPCGKIEFVEVQADWPETPYQLTVDVAAVDCALDMLLEGTPGLVYYEQYTWVGKHEGFIRIGEGRTGLTRSWAAVDLICPVSRLEVVQLRRRPYFLACKNKASPKERFHCLIDWSAGPALEVCAGEDDCYH